MNLFAARDIVAGVLTGLALGGMGFFAVVFAPALFRTLSTEAAGALVRSIFPIYYLCLASITGAAAVAVWNRPEAPVLGVVAALFIFSRFVLMPRINRARKDGLAGDAHEAEQFSGLHRLSVIINVAQMGALGIVLLRLMAT